MGILIMATFDKVYLGTTIKVAINATGTPNVPLSNMEYNVFVWANATNDADAPMKANVVIRRKNEAVEIDSNSAAVEVQTELIGRGFVIVRIEAQVPDADCAGGYRKEVEQFCPNIKIV